MFGDVERLKVILADLSDTISQPSALPVAAKEFVEVSVVGVVLHGGCQGLNCSYKSVRISIDSSHSSVHIYQAWINRAHLWFILGVEPACSEHIARSSSSSESAQLISISHILSLALLIRVARFH